MNTINSSFEKNLFLSNLCSFILSSATSIIHLIKCISCLKDGEKIPVHGDGSYVRDWTYVKDNVDGIMSIIDKKIKNQCFNIAANNYIKNIDVVRAIIKTFNKTDEEIQFVEDRWGQDVRYSVDTSKITKATGWKPKHFYGLTLDFINEKL